MGIDHHTLTFLTHAAADGFASGRMLTIGRQILFVQADEAAAIVGDAREAHDPAHVRSQIASSFPYSEGLFHALGASEVDSIDASDYEGAGLIHDMNVPIAESYHGLFDAIFDGGSLEHIFNVPVALGNMIEMLKPGGQFVGVYPANNFMGHGFYQFSPEFFFRVFSPENGCEIIDVVLFEVRNGAPWFRVADPLVARSRVELVNSHPTHIAVRARRTTDVRPFARAPQQSDYAAEAWLDHSISEETGAHAKNGPVAERPLLSRLARKLPWPVRKALTPTAQLARQLARKPFGKPYYQRMKGSGVWDSDG